MVLRVFSKMGLGNNFPMFKVYDVVSRIRWINRYHKLTERRIFHYIINMRLDVSLKTYSKMLLINKQPNAILKFCPIDDILLVQN